MLAAVLRRPQAVNRLPQKIQRPRRPVRQPLRRPLQRPLRRPIRSIRLSNQIDSLKWFDEICECCQATVVHWWRRPACTPSTWKTTRPIRAEKRLRIICTRRRPPQTRKWFVAVLRMLQRQRQQPIPIRVVVVAERVTRLSLCPPTLGSHRPQQSLWSLHTPARTRLWRHRRPRTWLAIATATTVNLFVLRNRHICEHPNLSNWIRNRTAMWCSSTKCCWRHKQSKSKMPKPRRRASLCLRPVQARCPVQISLYRVADENGAITMGTTMPLQPTIKSNKLHKIIPQPRVQRYAKRQSWRWPQPLQRKQQQRMPSKSNHRRPHNGRWPWMVRRRPLTGINRPIDQMPSYSIETATLERLHSWPGNRPVVASEYSKRAHRPTMRNQPKLNYLRLHRHRIRPMTVTTLNPPVTKSTWYRSARANEKSAWKRRRERHESDIAKKSMSKRWRRAKRRIPNHQKSQNECPQIETNGPKHRWSQRRRRRTIRPMRSIRIKAGQFRFVVGTCSQSRSIRLIA